MISDQIAPHSVQLPLKMNHLLDGTMNHLGEIFGPIAELKYTRLSIYSIA